MPKNPKPTETMARNAARGLFLRSQQPPSRRGGTAIGIARARDIRARRPLSYETIERMLSFFARHEVDKEAEGFRQGEKGYPSKGLQAWLLWGGDAGRAWARARLTEREGYQ